MISKQMEAPVRESLAAARGYLLARYRTLRSDESWEFAVASLQTPTEPCWIWQTVDLFPTEDVDEAAAAAIVDPDIGVCLYVLVFDKTLPVRAQISRAISIRSQLLTTNYPSNSPPQGQREWRVLLNWLVAEEDFSGWIEQLAVLREKTAHFSAIAGDIVSWRTDLSRVARSLATEPHMARATLELFLGLTAQRAAEAELLFEEIASVVSNWPRDLEATVDRLGRKIESISGSPHGSAQSRADQIEQEYSAELENLKALGKSLSDHEAYLKDEEPLVQKWATNHQSHCPICMTDVSGVLHMLRWNQHTPALLSRVRVNGDGAAAPPPLAAMLPMGQ